MARLALGGLALAALLAGGCAAPGKNSRARFGTVTGVVQDLNGNPIADARVFVVPKAGPGAVGTTNFSTFQDTGPFVTDAQGRFTIAGVTVNPNATVVLNLRAEKAGFVTAAVGHVNGTDVVVSGRTIARGTQTPDIVVAQGATVTDVSAILQSVGVVQQVGASGADISAKMPNPNGGASLGTVTVRIPAGVVSQPTTVSVTPLVGTALPGQAPIDPSSPFQAVAPGATVIADVPAAAVDITADPAVTFPADNPAFIDFTLPFTAAQLGLPLPAGAAPLTMPVLLFDSNTGGWTQEALATISLDSAGNPVATVAVTHFSVRILAVPSTWIFGSLVVSTPPETLSYNPVDSLPGGYVAKLPVALAFPGVSTRELGFLCNAFESLTLQKANGFVGSVVPTGADNKTGVVFTRASMTVTVRYTLPNGLTVNDRNGERRFWIGEVKALPPVPTPDHLQGHIQGGGGGS